MKYIVLGLFVIALSIGAVLVYERVAPTFDTLTDLGTTTPEAELIDPKALKDRDFKVGILEDERFTSLVEWPEYEAAAPIVGKSDIFAPAGSSAASSPAASTTSDALPEGLEADAALPGPEFTEMPSDQASGTPGSGEIENGL